MYRVGRCRRFTYSFGIQSIYSFMGFPFADRICQHLTRQLVRHSLISQLLAQLLDLFPGSRELGLELFYELFLLVDEAYRARLLLQPLGLLLQPLVHVVLLRMAGSVHRLAR